MARPSRMGTKTSVAKARNAKGRKTTKTKRRIASAATRVKRRSISDLSKDLKEAREQQAATADILKVIASSPSDVQPVFDAIAESARRLCGGHTSIVTQVIGDLLDLRASSADSEAGAEELRAAFPLPLSASRVHGRAALNGEIAFRYDTENEPDVTPIMKKTARARGYRSLLVVPMMREGVAIGTIGVSRREAGRFTDKFIELLCTFADQAVIAIGNVHLFEAVQAKTRAVEEALRYQTGSANILNVIASSPTDVQPVLNAIVESACEVCEANDAAVLLKEGNDLRFRAHHGPIEVYLEKWPITRGWTAGRAFVDGKPVHLRDTLSDEGKEFPDSAALSAFPYTNTRVRSVLSVPMLRESERVGVILLRRTEMRPFSDKQIALLQTFADQAVIAIENVRLFNETKEALEQQTATSEVLEVISSSTGELEPVFQKMLENATRICGAHFGGMTLYDGNNFHNVARYNAPPAFADAPRTFQFHPQSGARIAIRTRQVVHVEDIRTRAPYLEGDPAAVALADLAGGRTFVTVPLLRENEPVGVITIYRQEVRPFTERQIDLVANFAKQAVIAIENTRLLKELRERTDDLGEALQQQTATADVLKVISRSAFNLQTVLDTLVESAAHLCDADEGTIFQPRDDAYRLTASCGLSPSRKEFLESCSFQPGTGSTIGRVLLEGKTAHIEDSQTDLNYRFEDEAVRTRVGVPLLREGAPIGVFVLTRRDVRPFSDKQIELVQTFADQAVIAIENVRLFNETKEALERQTATADILKVIASSPDDVQPVFEAIAERSNRLVEGLSTAVYRLADDTVHLMAFTPISPAGDAALQAAFPAPLSQFQWGEAIGSGETYLIADAEVELTTRPSMLELARLRGWRSVLGVPLMRDGKPIGLITVTRVEPGLFDDHHVQLLQTFADQAVIAISNVGLFNEVQAAHQ